MQLRTVDKIGFSTYKKYILLYNMYIIEYTLNANNIICWKTTSILPFLVSEAMVFLSVF